MADLELNFCVPENALASLRQALHDRGARRSRQRAHGFDTADGALARHHLTLQLRLQGRKWVQALGAEEASAAQALAHEVRVPGTGGPCPALDLQRHAGSGLAQRLEQALRTAADPTLQQSFSTDAWRLQCETLDPLGTRVGVSLDEGRVQSGGPVALFTEFKLLHLGGPIQGLFDLAAACVRHGGLWQVSPRLAAQRLEHACEAAVAPQASQVTRATRATAPDLAEGADGPTLMRALLHSALQQALANAGAVAASAGGDTTEAVHQLRVGLRRLRVVLRELAPLSPAIQTEWGVALATTFASLGELRDAEAAAASVRPLLLAAAAPVLVWHHTNLPDARHAVRDPGFQTALLAVQGLACAGDERFAALSAGATRKLVAQRLKRLHRRVTRVARPFERLPLDTQHGVRKQLKRLRYLAELTVALWPERQVGGTLRRMARAQEALGVHHDVAVAAAAFRIEAAEHPEAWFAAGYLQAHLAVTARAARKTLSALASHPCPWR